MQPLEPYAISIHGSAIARAVDALEYLNHDFYTTKHLDTYLEEILPEIHSLQQQLKELDWNITMVLQGGHKSYQELNDAIVKERHNSGPH